MTETYKQHKEIMEEIKNNLGNTTDNEVIKPIHAAFQITRTIMFFVDYNVNEDKSHYFATHAALFNRPKSDYNRGGQCQESVLPHNSDAYRFFRKWDTLHLRELTDEQYNDLKGDISRLQEKYNSIVLGEPYNNVPFNQAKKLSMLKLKKKQPSKRNESV